MIPLARLEMPQARVEHFFHAAEFSAPQITHVVEALVDGIEPRVYMSRKKADHRSVEQHRYTDGEIKLLVRHQKLVRSV
jgi:hypothetical protein